MNLPVGTAMLVALSSATLAACSAMRDVDQYSSTPECPREIRQQADGTKQGYVRDVAHVATRNEALLRVEYTGKNLQLVLMTIPPGQHIGAQTSSDHDEFFRIDEGYGEILINDERKPITDRSVIIVPAGAMHDIVNTGDRPMRVHSIYSPPQYKRDAVQKTGEMQVLVDRFDGCVSE